MNVKHNPRDGNTIVSEIEGRIDVTNSPVLEKEFQDIIAKGYTRVIMDFSNVAYISSAGLRVLISVGKATKKKNGELFLCSLSPSIHKIFEMTGFTKIFKIYPTLPDVLKNLA